MNARQLLLEAVHREQEAHEFYSRLAKRISNKEGARTFAKLAEDEAGHRRQLESWWREQFREALPFDPARVKKPRLVLARRAGALAALELALEREETAARRYESLVGETDNAALKKICRTLAKQEWGHFETIKAEISAVTGNFYWFDVDRTAYLED